MNGGARGLTIEEAELADDIRRCVENFAALEESEFGAADADAHDFAFHMRSALNIVLARPLTEALNETLRAPNQ